ncbi:glycosyltransferase family 2 protein [Xanthocytophaga agilis]|uniref:Glycosyltransferase family 2 protein n=1 Tax=Xanthocytophaga agilis TaxID=3048010 RepID=A0AAE3RC53_9BACT|nr:glycosyltransferase family 2 protein [Xanthocytophaga agilis]MDJ1505630.1 glycosyltransferase family 2 protein [Xanthocytophaga agilis]
MEIHQLEQRPNTETLPLVSVVMATYNGSRYIAQQLESILGQTYPNIEIIISDDASVDHTQEILQNYAKRYENIRLLLHYENVGYVKNFERGIIASTGSLIAPSDQDDIWKPEKITRLVSAINTSDIVYCDSELISAEGEPLGLRLSQIRRFTSFSSVLNFTVGNSAPGHAMLIKRQVAEKALPLLACSSHDFWLGFVATFSNGISYLDEVHVQYRQHENNVCGAFNSKDKTGKKFKRMKQSRQIRQANARIRINAMYEKCPAELQEYKKILRNLSESYQSFSFLRNWNRMLLFFTYREQILAHKHRNTFRKLAYCCKLFFTIQ